MIKRLVILCSFALMLSVVIFSACSKTSENLDCTAYFDAGYSVVKVGDTFKIPEIKIEIASGKEYKISSSVKFSDGEAVTLKDDGFVAEKIGKYTVCYRVTDSDKASKSFYYDVYSNQDGKNFHITLADEDKISVLEYNQEYSLKAVKAVDILGREFACSVSVKDEDGQEISNFGIFSPKRLGAYSVIYSCGDAEISYTVNCSYSGAPKVYLQTYPSEVKYGDNFLLPYFNIDYPYSFDTYRTETHFYRENSISAQGEITKTGNRVVIDSGRYFTYTVTVEYGTDFSERVTYDFKIEREYNATIDSFTVNVNGNEISWQDRSELSDVYNGYYEVTGYELSLDGGKNFNIQTLTNSYVLTDPAVYSVQIREIRDGEGTVAASEIKCVDTTLSGAFVLTFDSIYYENMLDICSYPAFEYNSLHNLSYSVDENGYANNGSGVLKVYSSSYAGVKIEFPTEIDVTEDAKISLRIYAKKNNPLSYITVANYGTVEDFGKNIESYGLKFDSWCTVLLPVSEFFNISVGDKLKGLEIILCENAGVFVDYVKYYTGEIARNEALTAQQKADGIACSFDSDVYSFYITPGAAHHDGDDSGNNYGWNSENTLVTEFVPVDDSATNKALKISCENGGGINVKFPYSYAVERENGEKLKITLKLNLKDDWLFICKYGTDVLYENANQFVKELNVWTELTFFATDLGYLATDMADGVSVYVKGEVVIDEIRCEYTKNISDDQYFDNQNCLANFDYEEYAATVQVLPESGKDARAEVLLGGVEGSNGGALMLKSSSPASVKISLPRTYTVIDPSEMVSFRIYSTVDFKIVTAKSGVNADGYSVSFTNLGTWTNAYVSFAELGYSENDVFDCITVYINGGGVYRVLYLDEISVGGDADTFLAKFDDARYEVLLDATAAKWYGLGIDEVKDKLSSYYYYFGMSNSEIEDGVLHTNYKYYGSVGINFIRSVKVTEDLVITIKVKSTDAYKELYIAPHGKENTLGKSFKSEISSGGWTTLKFYATDIGASVGETLDGLDFYLGYYGGNFYIENISFGYLTLDQWQDGEDCGMDDFYS